MEDADAARMIAPPPEIDTWHRVMRERFQRAHARIWQLESVHGLMTKFGASGEFSHVRKDLSHFGAFDLELCCVALYGPGDDQQRWQSWMRHYIHRGNYRPWGRLRTVDPGNLFYYTLMSAVCCPHRQNAESVGKKTLRQNVKASTVGSLNIVHVGDVWEAILGLFLLAFDFNCNASLGSQHEAQVRCSDIADASVFADYFATITELHVLLRGAQQRYPSISDGDLAGMRSILA